MFEKIKKFFVNETIDDLLNKNIKNKKMTNEEKLSNLIIISKDFFDNKIEADALMATKENYFEKFVINNQVDQKKFEKYYKSEYEALVFSACLGILNSINILLNRGLDDNKLTIKEQMFIKNALILSDKCGFTNEKYPQFNNSFDNVMDELLTFVDDIKNEKTNICENIK